MHNRYYVRYRIKSYPGETLRLAQRRPLVRRDGDRPAPGTLLLVTLALVALIFAVSGCTSEASPEYDTGEARSDPNTASPSATAGTDAARFAGMRSSTSWECYTFYSDGTVELRHGGASAVSDTGGYQGDANFGEIVWDSGRWTSTVVAEGDGLIIDDARFSPVADCY